MIIDNKEKLAGLLEYKGCYGNMYYSVKNSIYYGYIININTYLPYRGDTLEELEENFINIIDSEQ
jgi:hypothetical protein